MAVPASGPLELRGDINLEVNGNVTDTNVALHQLSLDAGFSTPDAMSDFYGYSSVVPPSVVTQPSTNVDDTSMQLNGCVSDFGGENVSRGFYHGTNSTAASCNTKYTLAGTQGNGAFLCDRTGLPFGTTYYGWAWACNSAGETVGNRCTTATAYPPFNTCLCTGCAWICSEMTVVQWYNNAQSCHRSREGYVNPYSGAYTVTNQIFVGGWGQEINFPNSASGNSCRVENYCIQSPTAGVFAGRNCGCIKAFGCYCGVSCYNDNCPAPGNQIAPECKIAFTRHTARFNSYGQHCTPRTGNCFYSVAPVCCNGFSNEYIAQSPYEAQLNICNWSCRVFHCDLHCAGGCFTWYPSS